MYASWSNAVEGNTTFCGLPAPRTVPRGRPAQQRLLAPAAGDHPWPEVIGGGHVGCRGNKDVEVVRVQFHGGVLGKFCLFGVLRQLFELRVEGSVIVAVRSADDGLRPGA